MFPLDRLQTMRILASILLLAGLVYLFTDIARERSTGTRVEFNGPVTIGAATLRLHERQSTSGTAVDIAFGDHIISGNEPVSVVSGVPPEHYAERFGARFALIKPTQQNKPWTLLEVSAAVADVRHRQIELHQNGSYQVVPAHHAKTVRRSLLPAPTVILLGIALFVARGLRPAPEAAPTVLLVLLATATGALIAWPIMLRAGVSQTLPAAVLGLGVTALVALAGGTRAQRWLRTQAGLRRALGGAVVGCVLLGVFVAVTVNIQGFIAPVFRPPGQTLSPGEWFVRDFIRPMIALTSFGALPAVIGGAIYGLSQPAGSITHA